jgi:hypothetical protein
MLFELCVYLRAFWWRNLTSLTRYIQSLVNQPLARRNSAGRFLFLSHAARFDGQQASGREYALPKTRQPDLKTSLARSPSGKGGACKAPIMGSIPIRASKFRACAI